MQRLRKGAIVIIDGFHFPGYARVLARSACNADGRGPMIEFTTGHLNGAVLKSQCPLALEAVPDFCAYAGAAVVANSLHVFIQQWLIECQNITDCVTGIAGVDELGGMGAGIRYGN